MAKTHPHAEATYQVIPLPYGSFGVEVTIPETYPTKVSGFATKAAAERWILEHKQQAASIAVSICLLESDFPTVNKCDDQTTYRRGGASRSLPSSGQRRLIMSGAPLCQTNAAPCPTAWVPAVTVVQAGTRV